MKNAYQVTCLLEKKLYCLNLPLLRIYFTRIFSLSIFQNIRAYLGTSLNECPEFLNIPQPPNIFNLWLTAYVCISKI